MGNGPHPSSPPPPQHHWSMAPLFWATARLVIFTGILVWLEIRNKTPEKGQSSILPNQTVISKGPENSGNSVLTKSDEYTNVIVPGQPSINLGKKDEQPQTQLEESNQPAKFQEAELPQQIKPKEEEPATDKAVDELHAYGATIGGSGAATAREKPKAQDSKAISQTFGDLNIVFESLRALDNQTI